MNYFIYMFYSSLLSAYVVSKELNIAFPGEWNMCTTQEAYQTFVDVSFWKCELECMVRPQCHAIRYWRLQYLCEMITMIDGEEISKHHPYCISVSREEIEAEVKVPEQCKSCEAEETCDIETRTCSRKECQRQTTDNGDVLGNQFFQGARASVLCNRGYKLEDSLAPMFVCGEDGNWSTMPTCLKDCGNPPELSNVASVSAGDTIEGATRTYTCALGHVIAKGGAKTTQTTDTCNALCGASGTWAVDFECVGNCPTDWKLIGQSCYGFTKQVQNDAEGQLACEAEDADAHLAIFHTKEEWENVRSRTWTNAHSLWAFIGGKRNNDDIWTWNDGTPVEDDWGWYTGQPDNDNPIDCLFVMTSDRSFMLEDYNCDVPLKLEAFCELELSN